MASRELGLRRSVQLNPGDGRRALVELTPAAAERRTLREGLALLRRLADY